MAARLVACLLMVMGSVFPAHGQAKKKTPPSADPKPAAATAAPNTKTSTQVVDPLKKTAEAARAEWKPRIYNGRIYVSLQSVASYYGFTTLDLDGKQVSMSMKLPATKERKESSLRFDATVGDKRIKLNNQVFYFSYPVISFGGNAAMLSSFDVANVLDPILQPGEGREPSELRVVVLDPAGGGVEAGARSGFGTEKELTFDIARRLKPMLEQQGLTVVLTRDGDEAVFPLERIRLANLIREEAIYISIRAQAGTAVAKGIETSTLPPPSTPPTYAPESAEVDNRFFPGHINERESLALATAVQSNLIATTQATDLGIKRIPSEEMRGIEMPAIVCRVGYLSHSDEGKKLADGIYREKISRAMSTGVQVYAKRMRKNLEERRAEDAKRPLFFGRPQATHLDEAAGVQGERVIIRVPIIAAPGVNVDRSKLEVQLFVFERVNNIDLELTIADPPKLEWLSVLPDWKNSLTETFQVIYQRPKMTPAETEKYGRRSYYGYVARLVYDGKLRDVASDPINLHRCLYFFTQVFPKR